MAIKDCKPVVKKAMGEDLADDKLDEILDLLERRVTNRMKRDPLLGQEQAVMQAATELAGERKLAALIEKRSRHINAIRRSGRYDFYNQAKGRRSDAIHALLVGREGIVGGGRSVDAQRHGLELELMGPMTAELRKAGLLRVAVIKDPDFERAVAREMARANGAKIDPTGDKNAEAMAGIFVKYIEAGRVMQNEAGAYIRKLEGYVTRQSHDQVKIYKAGFEAWRAKIEPLLDERTFDDVDDRTAFLRGVYNNLATGNHQTASGASDWLGGFRGPGSLAKKVSAERALHFKGPDEAMDYNLQFGRASLFESVVDTLSFAARNTALMRTFGTNPEAAFRADVEHAIREAKKASDLSEVKALESWLLSAEFDQVSGGFLQRGTPTVASVNAAIRSVISMAKLGGVVLSSIPDIAIRASVLRHNGIGFLESYGNALTTFMEGRKGTEKREIADLLNAGVQGILGGVFDRFHAMDSIPGTFSKASSVFFRWSGLTLWTDAMSRGVGLMLSRNLANLAGRAFDALDPQLQTTLRRYGIDEKAWDVIRRADLKVADGENFLTPDAVKALSNDILPKRERDALATSLSTYFSDQIREAMTFAGARERALVTFGTSAGTPLGEAVRYIMQFKTFPVTYLVKHLGREMRRGGAVDGAGLAHLIVATTALGYLSMTAKEYAKGRSPRNPEDAAGWTKLTLAAMQQGGGLGIYGDFLFGQANRFGGGLIGTLAGPAAGLAEQYAAVLHAARDGDDPRAKALRAAVNTAPFLNLFYARLALDHLILYQMQEALNPGYLRRYERQVERDNNQTFWLPPTEALR